MNHFVDNLGYTIGGIKIVSNCEKNCAIRISHLGYFCCFCLYLPHTVFDTLSRTWPGRTIERSFQARTIAAALLVPALLAGVLGYFVFRSRVQGVSFSIITQALTLLTSIWFVGQQAYTGGTNGITNFGSARLFGIISPSDMGVVPSIPAPAKGGS